MNLLIILYFAKSDDNEKKISITYGKIYKCNFPYFVKSKDKIYVERKFRAFAYQFTYEQISKSAFK